MHTNYIFISHITEESNIAEKIKEWIEGSFLGQVQVFVSTNINDAPVGDIWFSKIEAAMSKSAACIVLCSANSVNRPWINFESGAAWIKRIPVIPVTYGGITKENLPIPLLFFQAENAKNPDFSKKLIESVSKHLKFSHPPRINYNEMQTEVEEVIRAIFHGYGISTEADELGIFDHMVQAEDCFGSVTSIFLQMSEQANLLTEETNEATIAINLAKSGGSARHLQKLARNFSEKVETRTNNIEKIIGDYNSNVAIGINSTNYIIKSKQLPLSDTDRVDLKNLLDAVTSAKQTISSNIPIFSKAANTAAIFPNLERHLRRSTLKLSNTFTDLAYQMEKSVLLLEGLQVTAINKIESQDSN